MLVKATGLPGAGDRLGAAEELNHSLNESFEVSSNCTNSSD